MSGVPAGRWSVVRPEIQQRVRDMQEESAIELSNQSKERALVGEVISTVALADPISRGFKASDQGIDMEIEFNLETGMEDRRMGTDE